MKPKALSLMQLTVSMVTGVLLGIVLFQALVPSTRPSAPVISTALEQIQGHYVEDLSKSNLTRNAVEGMLTGLDKYSELLDPHSYADLINQSPGEFVGIGIEIRKLQGVIRVISVDTDSPAEKSGIIYGDIINAINGNPTENLTLPQVVENMRGAIDESVALTIQRKDEFEKQEIIVQRELIDNPNVSHKRLANDIGYIRIRSFDEHADERLLASLSALQDKALLHGLILDLRNNLGGILQSSVGVAGAFLDGRLVVSTQRSSTFNEDDPKTIQYFAAKGDPSKRLPLAILINRSSASASEIVAGALQDHNRATLIGSTSFGKGTVQTLMEPLANGLALKITTAYYYTPSGRSFHNAGIEPDLTMPSGQGDEDELLKFASTYLLDTARANARL
jgi:carboxyl-terminal processing protease